MFIKQGISVGNLLLDLANYRIIKQGNQKATRDAIIAEQGRKLVKLAEDIIANGLNPFDLPMVIDAEDGNQNYIVVEGNRRLTAINLMLEPELAKDTVIYSAFSKLSKNHSDAIPKVLDCVIAPNKESALVWINRKHANGLEGAGTEHWSSMAKARADAEQGIPRPDLDVINFVLAHDDIDENVRHHLEGAKFNITTLERLVTTKELQDAAGFTLKSGKLVAKTEPSWLKAVLTDLVTTIANGKRAGNKFTERDIDAQDKREKFIASLLNDHPKQTKATEEWTVSGNPKTTPSKLTTKPPGTRGTLSTEEQKNLIPKKFKLNLPSGKVNDIFIELKNLDVVTYRHAVSVLFRVFVELSIQRHIDLHNIQLPKDGNNKIIDKLSLRLEKVKQDIKDKGLV
ncbi:hypothetical protein, partial [Methyloglobulus morosus]|uniref:hypothetical protein n=1 Tax=Methyloglobulus morosus TaxID=1410681 RepID=UPI00056C84D9